MTALRSPRWGENPPQIPQPRDGNGRPEPVPRGRRSPGRAVGDTRSAATRCRARCPPRSASRATHGDGTDGSACNPAVRKGTTSGTLRPCPVSTSDKPESPPKSKASSHNATPSRGRLTSQPTRVVGDIAFPECNGVRSHRPDHPYARNGTSPTAAMTDGGTFALAGGNRMLLAFPMATFRWRRADLPNRPARPKRRRGRSDFA